MYKLNGKLSKAHPANTLVRVFSIALVLVMTAGAASATPVLWGIDEDDGQLFSIDDYTQITVGEVAAGLTSYGHLKWNDNGRIRNIGKDMEAMALDSDGMAYIALDDRLG